MDVWLYAIPSIVLLILLKLPPLLVILTIIFWYFVYRKANKLDNINKKYKNKKE